MEIRAYDPDDETEVIQLWWQAWHSSSSYAHHRPIEDWRVWWQEIIADHRVAVMTHSSEIVAFAAVNVEECLLSQLFVSPSWQRKGLGKQLMCWVLEQCPTGFRLRAATDNRSARLFYAALGMQETSSGINNFNGRPDVGYTTPEGISVDTWCNR
ncbi:MAG: GNAT family N-acetyltransferase [Phormidesmis sp.]